MHKIQNILTEKKIYDVELPKVVIIDWVIGKVGQICKNLLLGLWKKEQVRHSSFE